MGLPADGMANWDPVRVFWTLILHGRRNSWRLRKDQRMESPKAGVTGSWQRERSSFPTRRCALTEQAPWLGGNRRGGTGFLKGVRGTRAQNSHRRKRQRRWQMSVAGGSLLQGTKNLLTGQIGWCDKHAACQQLRLPQCAGRLPRLIRPLDDHSFLLTPQVRRSCCQGTSPVCHE